MARTAANWPALLQTSLSQLPQELIERIVDHLHDDPTTLMAASITHRRLRSASLYHLFGRIKFYPSPETMQTVKDVLCTNSQLCSSPRVLVLYGKSYETNPVVLSQEDVGVLLRFSAVTSLYLSNIRAASASTLYSLLGGLHSLIYLSMRGNFFYNATSSDAFTSLDRPRLLGLELSGYDQSLVEYKQLIEHLGKTNSGKTLQALVFGWSHPEDIALTQRVLSWDTPSLSHLKLGVQGPTRAFAFGQYVVDPLHQQCLTTSNPIVLLHIELAGTSNAIWCIMEILAGISIPTIQALSLSILGFRNDEGHVDDHAFFDGVGSWGEPALDWQMFPNLERVTYNFVDIESVSGTRLLRKRFESAERREVSVLFLPINLQYEE